jgi:4-amino-4-deoxy-L-arabinose transferase-like glycosyltransferase
MNLSMSPKPQTWLLAAVSAVLLEFGAGGLAAVLRSGRVVQTVLALLALGLTAFVAGAWYRRVDPDAGTRSYLAATVAVPGLFCLLSVVVRAREHAGVLPLLVELVTGAAAVGAGALAADRAGLLASSDLGSYR